MNQRKIIVSGSPFEQGVQHGKAFASLIQENITYIQAFLQSSKIDLNLYQEYTNRNADFLKKSQPEQWEEITGIAVGSQLPLKDIVLINIPTYFIKNNFSQECSMLLAKGPATVDGKTYLIKNRDMDMTVHQVMVEYHYPDGSCITEVGGAGIITYPAIGINQAGLAITSTGTATGVPSNITVTEKNTLSPAAFSSEHIFVNLHHILRSCKTVSETLEFLNEYPRMNGLNIIVADETTAAVVETTPTEYQVQWVDNTGLLFRTNHYCLGNYTSYNLSPKEYPSTFARYERIQSLTEHGKKLRFQDLFKIMSDHKNSPLNSICRHPNGQSQTRTVSCSIIILEDRELFSTPGNPCEHFGYSTCHC